MVELSWQGPDASVAVITMNDDENRFDLDVVARWHVMIDEVATHDGPTALVTTGTDRFYSNGLALDWLLANPDSAREFLHEIHRLWGRILGLDCITVAALNGHCFGAGALLSSAHDRIVMREDRGYWCMPEVDLALPVSEKMAALLLARLPRRTVAEALNTGRRYTGPDALAAGIADEICPESEVLESAIAWAATIAPKSREVIGTHKEMLHGEAIRTLGA